MDIEELKRLHAASLACIEQANEWDIGYYGHGTDTGKFNKAIHNAFPAIIARLEAAQRLQQVSAGEPRWLIETSALSKNGPPRHFWDGKGWTWNALEAARYSSKQIAKHIVEADYKTYLLGSVHRKDIDVCEHLFQCGITPLAAFDKEQK